jgi:hypothetical protein
MQAHNIVGILLVMWNMQSKVLILYFCKNQLKWHKIWETWLLWCTFVWDHCVKLWKTQNAEIKTQGDQPTNQQTKDLTEGGDLRKAQVDVLGLYSHSCAEGIAGSVIDIWN